MNIEVTGKVVIWRKKRYKRRRILLWIMKFYHLNGKKKKKIAEKGEEGIKEKGKNFYLFW